MLERELVEEVRVLRRQYRDIVAQVYMYTHTHSLSLTHTQCLCVCGVRVLKFVCVCGVRVLVCVCVCIGNHCLHRQEYRTVHLMHKGNYFY